MENNEEKYLELERALGTYRIYVDVKKTKVLDLTKALEKLDGEVEKVYESEGYAVIKFKG